LNHEAGEDNKVTDLGTEAGLMSSHKPPTATDLSLRPGGNPAARRQNLPERMNLKRGNLKSRSAHFGYRDQRNLRKEVSKEKVQFYRGKTCVRRGSASKAERDWMG